MFDKITLKTQDKIELLDITAKISEIITAAKVISGQLIISVPHATAAILINENEPGLKNDIKKTLKLLGSAAQLSGQFEHNNIDNNAVSHISAALIGPSQTLIIEAGQLALGTYQQIFFVELDGPRENREIFIKIIKD